MNDVQQSSYTPTKGTEMIKFDEIRCDEHGAPMRPGQAGIVAECIGRVVDERDICRYTAADVRHFFANAVTGLIERNGVLVVLAGEL